MALALAACGHAESEAPPEPTPVQTARVQTGSVVERTRLSGRVVPPPDRDATLAPLVPGRLLVVSVRAGDTVKKGQPLFRIDPSSLESALGSAVAVERRAASDLELKRKNAERTRGLFEKGVSSRQDAEVDDAAAVAAETTLAEATATVAEARRRRGWADGVAPFDGVVLRVMMGAGEQVDGTPATPVLEVASPVPVEIAGSATSEVLARIAVGAKADVLLPGARDPLAGVARQEEKATPAEAERQGSPAGAEGPGRADGAGVVPPTAGVAPHPPGSAHFDAPLTARVTRVARAVDPATGVGEVRLVLDDRRAALLLGAPVTVEIALERKDGVLVVPVTALRRTGEGATEVVLVQDGKTAARKVTTGTTDGSIVEIVSGIAPGDEVVTDDPSGLADGTLVKSGS